MSGNAIGIQTTRLSDVQPEYVNWLWRGYIPLSKLTVLDGDPDNGKSTITFDLAARITRNGRMPDGTPSDLVEPAAVLILSAEDGLADTIRPRLDAAGADTSLVTAIIATVTEEGYEGAFQLPDDLDLLRSEIERSQARLIIIDPIMAFLSGDTNSFRDQDVRRALAPVSRLAEETEAAVLIVRHLNKAQGGSPLYRGGGSIGIIGAARSGMLAALDPDDESRRILAMTKSNLAAKAPSLAYRLEPAENGSVRIAWEGATNHSAGQLLSGPRDDEERTTRDDAKALLRFALKDGPVAVTELRRQWRDAGLSDASIRRAKTDLGIIAERVGGLASDGRWQWRLSDLMKTKVFTHNDEHLRQDSSSQDPQFSHENRETTKVLTPNPNRLSSNGEHLSGDAAIEALRDLYQSGQLDSIGPLELSTGERLRDVKGNVNTWLLQSELPGRPGEVARRHLARVIAALERQQIGAAR